MTTLINENELTDCFTRVLDSIEADLYLRVKENDYANAARFENQAIGSRSQLSHMNRSPEASENIDIDIEELACRVDQEIASKAETLRSMHEQRSWAKCAELDARLSGIKKFRSCISVTALTLRVNIKKSDTKTR